MLIYNFIYTSTPGQRSPKIWHSQIHVSLFKWFEQTHASIFPVKSHTMRIRCHIHAIMLIYKQFAVFLKTIHTDEVHRRNLRKADNGDVRWKRGAQISYSILFSIRLDAFRYVLSIEINRTQSVWRALVYTWYGRFSDVSTDKTYRSRPKYKNCRIVKSASDAIDCD